MEYRVDLDKKRANVVLDHQERSLVNNSIIERMFRLIDEPLADRHVNSSFLALAKGFLRFPFEGDRSIHVIGLDSEQLDILSECLIEANPQPSVKQAGLIGGLAMQLNSVSRLLKDGFTDDEINAEVAEFHIPDSPGEI